MMAAEILDAFKKLGIRAYVTGDKLVCEPGSKLPECLRPEIRQHKAELMALVSGLCFCVPPMPPAVVDGPECERCHLSGWCPGCRGCRWCSFQLKWKDQLEPEYK